MNADAVKKPDATVNNQKPQKRIWQSLIKGISIVVGILFLFVWLMSVGYRHYWIKANSYQVFCGEDKTKIACDSHDDCNYYELVEYCKPERVEDGSKCPYEFSEGKFFCYQRICRSTSYFGWKYTDGNIVVDEKLLRE